MFTAPHPNAHLLSRLTALQQALREDSRGDSLADALARWQHRLSAASPTLLLLGNYNAGKSTLINVLLGSEVAPTGDIPLTERITDYPWQGICLRDTPGLNAPVHHQQLTDAELTCADLILLVVRSGDVDEANLYQLVARLLHRGCALMVVLNGDSSEPSLLASWQQRLCQHLAALEQQGCDRTALSNMTVIPLNLQTAWCGREQGEPLLSASGYPLLETVLVQWTQKTLSAEPWRRPLLDEIEHGLATLLQRPGFDPAAQELTQERQRWQRLAHRLQQQGRIWLAARLAARRPYLCSALQSDDATSLIHAELRTLSDALHDWLAAEQPQLPWPALLPEQPTLPDPSGETAPPDLMSEVVNLAVPLLHSTLTRGVVRLNPVLSLLLGVAELYRHQHQYEQQAQQARERALLEEQRIGLLIQQLEATLTDALDKAVHTAVQPALTEVAQRLAMARDEVAAQARQQQVWMDWQQELQLLLGQSSDHLVKPAQ